MTSPYIRKESSPFLKRVLIPFWVLRMLVMVIGLAIFGVQFGVFIAYTDRIEDYARQYDTEVPLGRVKALLGVIVVMLFINLVLEIICIVKRSRRTLSPKFFLIVNVVQTTFVVIAFIMVMTGTPAPGGIAISVVFLLFFVGFLIYASVIFHQFRKGRLSADVEHAHQPVPMASY